MNNLLKVAQLYIYKEAGDREPQASKENPSNTVRSTIYSTGDVPNMLKAKKKYSFHASQSKKKSHKNSTISHTVVRAVKMYK